MREISDMNHFKSPLFVLLLGCCTILTACGGSSGSGSWSRYGGSSSSSSSSSSGFSSSGGISVVLTFENLYALAQFPVGVAVSAANEPYSIMQGPWSAGQRQVIEQHFSSITPGNIMKMSYLQPTQGVFTFGNADALVEYAQSKGIGVHAHTLVWHSDYQVPDWMKNFSGDKDAWLQVIEEHVTGVASYFAGRVVSWDVVNEAFEDNGAYRNSLFYQKMGADYIEAAFVAARAADPVADLYYNDYNISGQQPKLDSVVAMAEDFIDRGVPINGVGFQMHIQMGWPSISTIKASLQRVVDLGLKVKITELDIPINNPFDGSYSYPNNYQAVLTPELAAQQKRRFCEVIAAYLEVVPEELRGGITFWGVFDRDTWLKQAFFNNNHEEWPLLFNHDLQPKPAAQGVGDALMGNECQ
jgi:endo-1,4-beta-xylanase